jgi:SAM-dependent methyltransferase
VVISTQVLYRAGGPIRFIEEIYKCLKKGGLVLLSTPCMWSTDGGRWYYTKHGLKILFEKFSKVEINPNCYSLGSFFLMINLYLLKLIKIPLYPIYMINNILGEFFDRLVRNDMFVVGMCLAPSTTISSFPPQQPSKIRLKPKSFYIMRAIPYLEEDGQRRDYQTTQT